MNASELLRSLQQEGVQLRCEGEELRYRGPKGLFSAGLIEALAARKQEIIQLLQNRSVAGPCFQAWSPPPSDSQEVYPLSFAQQRMWFLQQLEPDSCSLNVALGFFLDGPLDVPALERSLGELIDRHEAFRTTCAVNDAEPLQVIVPAGGSRMPLEIVDLGSIPEPEREPELQRLITLEARRPFALDRSRLLRATLFQFDEDRHALLLTTHHFVVDGWSVGVMLRDLSALYDANYSGRPSCLETLTSRYCDYAIWQRERLQGEVLEELLGYWKGKLGGAAELNLPTDRPVSVSPSGRGATHRFDLPSHLSEALKAFSRREGVTLFTTLLTAFKALLFRYSAQNEVIVGTAVSDRCMVETQTLVGCFANTLVLQTLCDGNPTFRQLLHRVHDTAIEAFDHQDMPFDVLVEQLRPERLDVRNPLFQVSFLLHQHADDHSLNLTGLKVQRLPIELGTSRFDLLLEFQNQGEQLSGLLEYSTDLFDSATIEGMARHFQILLEGMVREPDWAVARVSMLTEAEAVQVVRDWNQTASTYPAQRCVHEEFESHARLQPDAPAAVAEGGTVSYGELDDRSEWLAEYLRGEGVSAGTRVALGMDRSVEMIVGMLAVLKAGGVYVPLDPAYPADRLAFLLSEVEAPLILTVEEVASCFPPTAAKVICLDKDWSLIEGHAARIGSTSEAPAAVSSRDLAYVIFTSGSTGAPKGVAVSHRAITRLVLNTNYLELGPQDRIAHLSNVCFDAATFEIWGALLNGGCIVLVSKAVALDPERFAVELQRHQVSALFLTTALFNELATANDRIFQGVKQVLFGGEAVNPEPVRRVLESGGPPRRLLHVYGPTECTTFATFYPVTHVEREAATIPIGRPISNTTAYVLDPHGNPLPVGVPGELYLGGPGVAQGYVNQPELTRESFVADPFAADSTQRLYRTGDIVKYLRDGNIEFIGRADGQVKIRGYRIELGEIESALVDQPGVAQGGARVFTDENQDQRLVAYVVPRADQQSGPVAEPLPRVELNLTALREGLLRRLPGYMMPSAFVVLDKLPLTPNGKIDRQALPAPERPVEAYRAPRTPQEEILCEIFADLLLVERVGVDDSFFELGGHSLLALQLIMSLRKILHMDIPVTALFEHPTISDLGRHIEEMIARNLATVRPPIEKVSRDQPLPLSFAQQRLWRNERAGADSSNLNVMIFTVEGELDVASLERSLQELVRRHEIFRSTFHTVDGLPVQRVAPESDFRLGFLDLSEIPDPNAETLRLLFAEKTSGMSLERGPLMRASVFRWARNHHKIVLTLHHMVYDVWSLPIFFNELHALYVALRAGKASALPALGVQQADFAVWQRKYLDSHSTTYQAHLAFWLKQLSGNPVLKLPCERVTPLKTASIEDVIVRFNMSEELSAGIKELSRQEGVSLFMTLLTALKALINLLTGQNEIMLGTYMANRSAPGCEDMMGYFCDIGLLRTTLSSDLSFLEGLGRVRETVLNAHAHEDMPFEVLGNEMQKCGYGWPAVRAMFMVGTSPTKPYRLGDLEMKFFPGGNTKTMMPWNFQMGVHDGGRAFSGRAKFDACQHDPSLVRRMVRNYVRLLEAVMRDPAARLSDLEETLVGR